MYILELLKKVSKFELITVIDRSTCEVLIDEKQVDTAIEMIEENGLNREVEYISITEYMTLDIYIK